MFAAVRTSTPSSGARAPARLPAAGSNSAPVTPARTGRMNPMGSGSVEIGRGAAERINGDRSLVLERRSCERVLVAALGGVGLLGELTDLLARLRAARPGAAAGAVAVPDSAW